MGVDGAVACRRRSRRIQPMTQAAVTEAGIPSTAFKYAENTGQFQQFREQAGTFSDSIKLWSS